MGWDWAMIEDANWRLHSYSYIHRTYTNALLPTYQHGYNGPNLLHSLIFMSNLHLPNVFCYFSVPLVLDLRLNILRNIFNMRSISALIIPLRCQRIHLRLRQDCVLPGLYCVTTLIQGQLKHPDLQDNLENVIKSKQLDYL